MRIWWYRVLYVRSSFKIKKMEPLNHFWLSGFVLCFPAQRRKGAGNEVPCWGLGWSPKQVWAAAQRNPISEEKCSFSAECGAFCNWNGFKPKKQTKACQLIVVREQSGTWRWISANFSIRRKRLKLCIFPAISKENAAFAPQKPAFRWKRFKKCQKKIKKGVDTGTKSRYNNWAVSARH